MNSTKPCLLMHTARIGDLILGIPLIKRLRLIHPKSPLYLICREGLGTGDLFLELKLVDKVYEVTKGNKKSYQNVFNKIQAISFHEIYCLHSRSFRSVHFIRKLKAKKKIGFKKWWNFWGLNIRVPDIRDFPEPLRLMSLLSPVDLDIKKKLETYLGRSINPPRGFLETLLNQLRVLSFFLHHRCFNRDFFNKSFWKNMKESSHVKGKPLKLRDELEIPSWSSMSLKSLFIERGKALKNKVKKLEQKKKRLFMAPGSQVQTRKWTNSGFINLGRRLAKEGWEIVFVGSLSEREAFQRISDCIPGALNLTGITSFYETISLFLEGHALVATDSGTSHLAALAEIPTVSLFGPTCSDKGFRPWQKSSVIIEKILPCRPCYTHGPKICPLNTHDCMEKITEEEVYKALSGFLKK